MNRGYLSQYFEAVAAKRLTAVEVNARVSNQHEFTGSAGLKTVLGTYDTDETTRFPTRFIWMSEENETVAVDGFLSWYNARYGKNRAAEWRLFYPTNDVLGMSGEGDLLFIAKRPDNSIMCIVAAAGSTMESQLLWLFNVPVQAGRVFVSQNIEEGENRRVDYAVQLILDELGIEVEEPEADRLDTLLERFGGVLPGTREFSIFARQTLQDIDGREAPDFALMQWVEQEEKLFRRMERQIVDQRLRTGFISEGETDVDGFISFSLSVQNRRKSRAGYALENHLEEIFRLHGITHSRTAETENRTKPDFLFPSGRAYHDMNFPPVLLSMLGVKTTCKDRWRQVLSEAARISDKHLFTLEPAISENQTNEMQATRLQLVLPEAVHQTYRPNQQSWLMNLSEFIDLARDRQQQGAGLVIA